MPFLGVLLGNWRLIAIGAAALFVAGLWLRLDYVATQRDNAKATVALREKETREAVETANANAEAVAAIRESYQRADAAHAKSQEKLRDVEAKLSAARKSALSQPATSCPVPERITALFGVLQQRADSAHSDKDQAGKNRAARNLAQPVVR